MSKSRIVQVWECPKCGYRLEAPIRYTFAGCGKKHGSVKEQRNATPLVVIWDEKSGEPMPA